MFTSFSSFLTESFGLAGETCSFFEFETVYSPVKNNGTNQELNNSNHVSSFDNQNDMIDSLKFNNSSLSALFQDLYRQGRGSDRVPGGGHAAGEGGALRPHREHRGHAPHQARHQLQRHLRQRVPQQRDARRRGRRGRRVLLRQPHRRRPLQHRGDQHWLDISSFHI